MSESLVCTFTDVGLRALVNAQNNGLKAEIVALAVGRGATLGATFGGYTPVRASTGLKNETARVPILSGTALGSDAGFRLLAVVPASSLPAEYWIQEVAAILADGTVLAIWSDPLHPLTGKTARSDTDLAYDLFIDEIPAGLLNITVIDPDIPDTTAVLAGLLSCTCRSFIADLAQEQRAVARGVY